QSKSFETKLSVALFESASYHKKDVVGLINHYMDCILCTFDVVRLDNLNMIKKLLIMKTSILGLFLLLFASIAMAQFPGAGGNTGGSNIVGKISGQVIDSTTMEPVEFATIALRRSGFDKDIDGTISDAEGYFTIPNVKPGSYDVNISFIGYNTRKVANVELTLESPDANIGTVKLATDQVLLETVKVEGQKALVENKVDRLVYNAENDVSVKGGDASDVLRKVPMLNVDMNGNVSLRGSQNIKILVNGKPSGIFSGSIADALKMIPA